MSHLLDALEKAQSLPPGHMGKAAAAEKIKEIYSQCRGVEAKWIKRFPKKINTELGSPLKFCNEICDMLGQKRLNEIIFNSKDVHTQAGAHYNHATKSIHFKWASIWFTTLVHELTHHFGHSNHGKGFCEIENFLFQVAYTHLTGKKLKSDW